MKFAKLVVGVGLIVALGVGTFNLTYAKYSKIEEEKAKSKEGTDIVKLLEKSKKDDNSKEISREEDANVLEANSETEDNSVVDDISNEAKDKEDKKSIASIKNEKENKSDNFIFIGDSRTVAYKDIVDVSKYDFITFIAKVSQGYDWFSSSAINELNKRLTTTDLTYNIVLNLGVNDLHNASKYVNAYNELAKNNPKHNFFVVSVNPEDEAKMKQYGYKYIGNEYIVNFNNTVKDSLSENIQYIDSYTYLTNKGFETTDGLHYSKKTSSDILDYISNYIKAL